MAYCKTEYICDCGEEWGNCGKKAGFIMAYNNTVDIGSLYYFHGDQSHSMGGFTDIGLAALEKLLLMNNAGIRSALTPEEIEITKKF